MNENSRLLLEKAQRSIQAAQTLLDAGNLPDFATGRAYYAMFYVAEALLEEKSLRFSKHGGVQRIEGDYGAEIMAVTEDAQKLIAQAKEFLTTARSYLESLP